MKSIVNNSAEILQQNRNPVAEMLNRLNQLIAEIEIHNTRTAKLLTNLIPASCPFERDVQLFGHKLFHIPPLCKLNPFFESLMILRFHALTYLSEQ